MPSARTLLRQLLRDLLRPKQYEKSLLPELVNVPSVGGREALKVLVLAPHPDDEVIGCGGTLLKHIKRGDEVSVAIVCTSSTDRAKARVRLSEAEEVSRFMGFTRTMYLGYTDRAFRADSSAVDRVTRILDERRPDLIYAPSRFERHPDHYETHRLLDRAVRRIYMKPVILFYEVWTPLIYPDIVVDITDFVKLKINALLMYKSQFEDHQDWIEGFTALNRFRGHSSFAGAYAECFLQEGSSFTSRYRHIAYPQVANAGQE